MTASDTTDGERQETSQVIDAAPTADKWRYTCPKGHRDWRPCTYVIECKQCGKSYESLIDRKHQRAIRVAEQEFYRSDLPTNGGTASAHSPR